MTPIRDLASGLWHVSRRNVLTGGCLALVCLLTWMQQRGVVSLRDTVAVAQQQLVQMRNGAVAISALRQAPQAAASRTRAHEELLAQVEGSLAAAGINRGKWLDSVPQPAERPAKSEYRTYATRLRLEGLSLRELATFAHDLTRRDPTLIVSSLSILNRLPGTPEFDMELGVSYCVYAPRTHEVRRPHDIDDPGV